MSTGTMPHPITSWVKHTCCGLARQPDRVVVREVRGSVSLLIEVTPGDGNEGVILGVRGRAIQAVREIAFRMGERYDGGLSVSVSVVADRRTLERIIREDEA